MLFVDKILYRHMTSSDFNNIEGVKKPEGGGGQTYIDLSGINPNSIVDFFKYASIDTTHSNTGPYPPFRVNAIPVGMSDSFPLEIYVRRGTNYAIRNQFSNRFPAWQTTNGFPTIVGKGKPFVAGRKYSDLELNPYVLPIVKRLVIYIVRTTNNLYFADYIYSDHLHELWPCKTGLEDFLSEWKAKKTEEGRGIITPSKLVRFTNTRDWTERNGF